MAPISFVNLKFFKSQQLLIAQVFTHASILPMIYWARPHHYAISFFIYFMTGCFGMSMTYHRLLSHKAWPAPRWFERLGSLLGTLGLTGTPIAWCAVHRAHHVHTDDRLDPHSPLHQNFWRVQFMSLSYKPNLRIVKDLLRDPFQVFLHRRYLLIHFIYVGFLSLLDPFAPIYGYLFPNFILWNAGSSINTLGHMWGYKNYVTRDESRNNWLLGYLVWGEGWHNNHHRFPNSPFFGRKWYEFDLAGLMIKLIR